MIYVFKTSVKAKKEVEKVNSTLIETLEQSKWNFDLEDCDNILRVDSKLNIVQKTIIVVNSLGFICIELE